MKLTLKNNQNGSNEEETENFICEMQSCFKEMLDTGLFSDVKVICDAVEIPAHKSVLAARVPFFKEALLQDTTGKNSIETPPTIELCTVMLIIDYAYFKPLKVNLQNAQALLEAAVYFHIEYLRHLCDQFIAERIELSVGDCLVVQRYSVAKSAEQLARVTNGFIAKHLADIIHIDGPRRSPGSEAKSFSSTDSIRDEELSWEALVKWIQVDVHGRKHLMPELLRVFPLMSLSVNNIITKVLPHPYVDSNSICREMIHDLLSYKADPSNKEIRQKCANKFSLQNRSSNWEMFQHIYFFASNITGCSGSIKLQVLQSPHAKWIQKSLRGVPRPFYGRFEGIVKVGNTIYCVSSGNRFLSYTPANNRWTEILYDRGRPNKLYKWSMCSLNEKLHVCDIANDKHGQLMLLYYCYDASTNCWQSKTINNVIMDRRYTVRNICGVTLNGRNEMLCVNLAAVGTDGSELCMGCYLQIFDLSAGTLLHDAYGGFSKCVGVPACVSYKGKVFIAVEQDIAILSTMVVVYDGNLDKWAYLPGMNVGRQVYNLVVVANDCLYAIGGDLGSSFDCSVEYIHLTDDNAQWQHGPKLLDLKDSDEDVHFSAYSVVC